MSARNKRFLEGRAEFEISRSAVLLEYDVSGGLRSDGQFKKREQTKVSPVVFGAFGSRGLNLKLGRYHSTRINPADADVVRACFDPCGRN